jgi:flagellar hook-associated protein 3 FlgL
MNATLQDRFNNMLYLLERHSAGVTEKHTEMGSRMLRLDLLQVRLEEDEVTYTDLMSKNEDTNLPWAIMQKSNAELALQASLNANAKIMQLSLANYI